MNDLEPFLNELSALISKISPEGRRHLAADIGRQVRSRQQNRIRSQVEPDGSPFKARKVSREGVAHAIRNEEFMYFGQKRKIVNAYKDEGDNVMGYCVLTGGFRRFSKLWIQPPAGANWGVHKSKRKIKPMFAKIRTAKYLKMRASSDEALVQFLGGVSGIADAHHSGRGRPQRRLLGLPAEDIALIKDLTIKHLALSR